ncbi:hypothetical protein V8C86DRAFT_1521653 [Haematococcus lacustris]
MLRTRIRVMLRSVLGTLVFLCALLRLARSQIPLEVLPLTFETFEHHTQAATGQTTGRWLVLFNSHLHHRAGRASKVFAELASDEEKDVIVAEVDLDAEGNRYLAVRFPDIQPPAAVLFRDRLMYEYPGSVVAEDAVQQVKAFYQSDYAQQVGKLVPSARKLPSTSDIEKAQEGKWVKIALGVAMLAVGWWIKNKFGPSTAASPPPQASNTAGKRHSS